MCCTLDENAKAAVTKACALISEDHEEFSVSIQQLHDVRQRNLKKKTSLLMLYFF